MTLRTIQQLGQAYGATPASITALLDGSEIYSGPVLTVNEMPNREPGAITNILFSWTQDVLDSTPKKLEISVSGSQVLLTDTLSDRILLSDVSAFYGITFYQTIDSVLVGDPYTDVMIDGIPMTRKSNPTGQWYWLIPAGSIFQATFNCIPGINYPEWDPSVEYPAGSWVIYQNICFQRTEKAAIPNTSPLWDVSGWIPYTGTQHLYFQVPVWNIDKSYIKGSGVRHNGWLYEALQDIPPGISIHDTNYWKLFVDTIS